MSFSIDFHLVHSFERQFIHSCALALALTLVTGCAHNRAIDETGELFTALGKVYEIENVPQIEGAIHQIQYGGLSGLDILKETDETISMISLTDRGPNGKLVNKKLRPFAVPNFSPSLIYLEHTKSTGRTRVTQVVPIQLDSQLRTTGLPNNFVAEQPVDLNLKPISTDPNGLDSEGVAVAPDGSIWICDEYGPSIVKLNSRGEWQKRFVPEGTWVKGMKNTYAILPQQLAQKRTNRGFEALAFEDHTLFAFLQSPLEKNSKDLMIVEFDTLTEKVVARHHYKMNDSKIEKIGDVVALGNKTFLAIELDDNKGVHSQKYIQWIDLNTNQSRRLLNLVTSGFTYSQKAEGLAYSKNSKKIFIINDNDFNFESVINPNSNFKIESTRLLSIDFHLH
jgi:hypothetical protein